MIGLCDRFRCLPSELAAEDVKLVRMLKILELADTKGVSSGEPG